MIICGGKFNVCNEHIITHNRFRHIKKNMASIHSLLFSMILMFMYVRFIDDMIHEHLD